MNRWEKDNQEKKLEKHRKIKYDTKKEKTKQNKKKKV